MNDSTKEIVEPVKKVLDYGLGRFTVGKLLSALIILFICIVAIRIINKIIKRATGKTKADKSVVNFIRAVIKVILYFVTVLIVADTLGIPITSIIAVFSVVGLAVSLSVQDLLANLVSGLSLLINKPFIANDFVEISGVSGTVSNVGIMYTTLLTSDNKTVFLPNKDVCASNIINYSHESTRRVDLTIGVSYENDIDSVREAIGKAINNVDLVLSDPKPFIGVKEYDKSRILYDIKIWCNNGFYLDTFYSLNEQIKKVFDKEGIKMTYDHINVHMVEKDM